MSMLRKRPDPLDDYIQSISLSTESKNKRLEFYENLRMFYRRKWQCPVKVPYVQGVEIDLFSLYEIVASMGGWQRVTAADRWNEVACKLSIDENTQNAVHALRLIYTRYLGKYEQAQFGNDNDNEDCDLLGGRLRTKGLPFALLVSTEAPFTVPKSSHQSNDAAPNYDKLELSLMSGLPNEIDFAINVITLLSHPGPYVMRFSQCPNIITLLMAHCSPSPSSDRIKDSNCIGKLQSIWAEQLDYDLNKFWQEAGINDEDFCKLITTETKAPTEKPTIFFDDDKLDLYKVVNWRVSSILAIFRNLSFEKCNIVPLAGSIHFLNFLLLCVRSRWAILVNNALDTLSNIASKIDLNASTDPIFHDHLLLKILVDFLNSNDQFHFLRAVETLDGLCRFKSNEPIIYELMNPTIFDRIFVMLTHRNILSCVTILEMLLQVSHLGKRLCDSLVEYGNGNSINILVNFLSVDAASILAGTTEHARIKVAQVHEATGRVQPYVAKRPAADSYAKRQQLQQIGRQNAVQAPPDASYRINNQIVGNAHQQQHEIVTIPRPNSNSLVVNGENKQQQHITARVEEDEDGFMCEWDCCGKTFYSPETLLHHTTNFHLLNRKPPDPPKKGKGRRPAANKQQKKVVDPELDTSTNEQFLCKWPFCTDTISRTLWSMVTHLQERHCNESFLQISLRKRQEMGTANYLAYIQQQLAMSRENVMTPGYSKFAAIEAIRRNATDAVSREFACTDEGPVTKSIRLTTSLILRNIAKYSVLGRNRLQKFENILSTIAFSRMESGVVLSQCLRELSRQQNERTDQPTTTKTEQSSEVT